MQSVSNDNFGPLIAYLIPGATALIGLVPFSPAIRTWLAATPDDAPTIGGFLYLTIASLAVGMAVSAIRWAAVDFIHARTGLKQPPLDFSNLRGNVDAFSLLIEIHYRHYQFHANMFVAVAFLYACLAIAGIPLSVGLSVALLILEVVFFRTSRDNLRKYYARTAQLLGGRRGERR